MEFVVSLYREQIEGGRYFLHEHPSGATSWKLESMMDLMSNPTVERVDPDQCQFGSEVVRGPHAGRPVKKPTGFASNLDMLLARLARRCLGANSECSRPGRGTHVQTCGHVTKDAAIHPAGLCRAIIRCIIDQLK